MIQWEYFFSPGTSSKEENSDEVSDKDTTDNGVDSKDGGTEGESGVDNKDGSAEANSKVASSDGRSKVDSEVENRNQPSEVDAVAPSPSSQQGVVFKNDVQLCFVSAHVLSEKI